MSHPWYPCRLPANMQIRREGTFAKHTCLLSLASPSACCLSCARLVQCLRHTLAWLGAWSPCPWPVRSVTGHWPLAAAWLPPAPFTLCLLSLKLQSLPCVENVRQVYPSPTSPLPFLPPGTLPPRGACVWPSHWSLLKESLLTPSLKQCCPWTSSHSPPPHSALLFCTKFPTALHHSILLCSRSVVSDSLWPCGLQHARLPCPSPTPGACSNSCPSSQWCHPPISPSVVPYSSCLYTLYTYLWMPTEKAMAPHSSTLAWKIPWMEEPGGLQSMGSLRVGCDWVTSLSLFTFHFHALEKEMAPHSSVLAWRIPGTGEPGGLPSMGLHRVGHDWSDLAAAV